MADYDRAPHRKLSRIDQRDRIAPAVADHDSSSIRRNSGQTGSIPHVDGSDNIALLKVDYRNVVGAGVCNVSTAPIRRDIDKIRGAMHSNVGQHSVALGINYAHVCRAAVYDVDFVSLGIGRDAGGSTANAQSLL